MEKTDKLYVFSFLPWQILFVFFINGLFASQFFYKALLIFSVIFFIQKINHLRLSLLKSFLCFLMGFAFGFFILPHGDKKLHIPQGRVWIKGCLEKVILLPEKRLKMILTEVSYKNNDDRKYKKLSGKLLWVWGNYFFVPSKGQLLYGRSIIKPISPCLNPGTLHIKKYWVLKGVYYKTFTYGKTGGIRIYGDRSYMFKIRSFIKEKIIKNSPDSKGKSLLLALLMGDKSLLTYDILKKIRKASLSHCFALSGMHLGFMVMFGWLIVWILGWLSPNIFLYLPRYKLVFLVSIPFVLFFVIINNHIPSLIRAGIMFLFLGVLFLLEQPNFLLDGIFFSLLMFVVFAPATFFEVSLQLSYVATISIVFFLPYIYKLSKFLKKKTFMFLFITFGISVVANLGVLPLICYYFGKTSPTIYLNVIWVPILGWITIPSGFSGLFLSFFPFFSSVSKFFFFISVKSLDFFVMSLDFLEKHHMIYQVITPRPGWIEIFGYWIFIAGLFLFLKGERKNIVTVGIGILMMLMPYLFSKTVDKHILKLEVLDVKDGESYFLITKNGHKILINGGGTRRNGYGFGEYVLSYTLTYRNLPSLDKVILTYPKFNRIRGLYFLMDNYSVGEFLYSTLPSNKKDKHKILKRLRCCSSTRVEDHKSFLMDGLFFELYQLPYLYKRDVPMWVLIRKGKRNLVLFVSKIPEKFDNLTKGKHSDALVIYFSKHDNLTHLMRLCKIIKPTILIISCGFPKLYENVAKRLNLLNIKTFSNTHGAITLLWCLDGIKVKRFDKTLYFIPYSSH